MPVDALGLATLDAAHPEQQDVLQRGVVFVVLVARQHFEPVPDELVRPVTLLARLARRAQVLGRYPYGEIRDNLIAEGCSPLDILRFKLAFFGAAKFDPKSSLWTRITMFQGAPLMSELDQPWADDWWLSVAPQNA